MYDTSIDSKRDFNARQSAALGDVMDIWMGGSEYIDDIHYLEESDGTPSKSRKVDNNSLTRFLPSFTESNSFEVTKDIADFGPQRSDAINFLFPTSVPFSLWPE
ncbi:hypothetical protein CEXT_321251 [Caerostris extrusa]|uniref:Uncharacterized protein n=1 Tax=Caerostris extrusa TaxID=172846 RepID=A0AAV4PW64_CAEEX|nr:hypothetical protein CEXT_321251 [Caerostris extrusa]